MNDWLRTSERGSSLLIRFMIWLCRSNHRWLVNLILYPIAAYFFLTGRTARKASMHFFSRVNARASWSDYYRQLLCFSRCLVDRVAILNGDADKFTVNPTGREALFKAMQGGQGIIMLGSHLGSFEACKLLARERMGIDIHIVAYFSGSSKIRRALDDLNPSIRQHWIDPTAPDAVFRMREVIDNGGILAILGDRTGIGEKKALVDFMGSETFLPTGPYYLASILHCPVLCFFGVRTGTYSYDTFVIEFSHRISLQRGKREIQAQAYAQKFADILAEKARRYPYNWFNFYEFWNVQGDYNP